MAALAMLLALLVLHALDHSVRQSAPVPTGASTLGTLGFVVTATAFAFALSGSRWAWPLTALVAFGTTFGFLAVHVAPDWGPFSQPYADIPVDALSWVGMLVPAVVAFGVGVFAVRAGPRMRSEGTA
ncbi:MAG: hypothetical protein M3350_09145 [Actinomycetota bacterium]|nr:hypothetical protein [Actinomycetota bacterium]MDQ3720926.1 hypothetical protein [Actinomycetota bacterium]